MGQNMRFTFLKYVLILFLVFTHVDKHSMQRTAFRKTVQLPSSGLMTLGVGGFYTALAVGG
jgi:hypothetical protein